MKFQLQRRPGFVLVTDQITRERSNMAEVCEIGSNGMAVMAEVQPAMFINANILCLR